MWAYIFLNFVLLLHLTFRTAVPFWGQTTQISSSLYPKRDCGSKGVKITPPPRCDEVQTRFPLKHGGAHTTKIVAVERFRRESCSDATLDVFSTPFPLSRNSALLSEGVCCLDYSIGIWTTLRINLVRTYTNYKQYLYVCQCIMMAVQQ